MVFSPQTPPFSLPLVGRAGVGVVVNDKQK
jgi:hypothetical protein